MLQINFKLHKMYMLSLLLSVADSIRIQENKHVTHVINKRKPSTTELDNEPYEDTCSEDYVIGAKRARTQQTAYDERDKLSNKLDASVEQHEVQAHPLDLSTNNKRSIFCSAQEFIQQGINSARDSSRNNDDEANPVDSSRFQILLHNAIIEDGMIQSTFTRHNVNYFVRQICVSTLKLCELSLRNAGKHTYTLFLSVKLFQNRRISMNYFSSFLDNYKSSMLQQAPDIWTLHANVVQAWNYQAISTSITSYLHYYMSTTYESKSSISQCTLNFSRNNSLNSVKSYLIQNICETARKLENKFDYYLIMRFLLSKIASNEAHDNKSICDLAFFTNYIFITGKHSDFHKIFFRTFFSTMAGDNVRGLAALLRKNGEIMNLKTGFRKMSVYACLVEILCLNTRLDVKEHILCMLTNPPDSKVRPKLYLTLINLHYHAALKVMPSNMELVI